MKELDKVSFALVSGGLSCQEALHHETNDFDWDESHDLRDYCTASQMKTYLSGMVDLLYSVYPNHPSEDQLSNMINGLNI